MNDFSTCYLPFSMLPQQQGDENSHAFDLICSYFDAFPSLVVYISDVLYFSHENAYYSHSYVLRDSHSPPSSDKVSRSSLYFVINPPAAAAADFPKPYVKKDLMLPPYVPSSYAPLLRMIAYTYLSRVITGSEDS